MDEKLLKRLKDLSSRPEESLTNEEFIEMHELYALHMEEMKNNLICELEKMGIKKNPPDDKIER